MKLEWFYEQVPNGIEIHQVYAVVFTNEGQILLKTNTMNDGSIDFNLAGGTPEEYDKDLISTLRRDYLEAVNTTLKDPIYYLGYQLVDEENGIKPYAQVRMTAIIDSIGESKPDPDKGITYGRILVSPKDAIKLLGWGTIGEKIITKAVEVAKKKFSLKF